MIAAHYEVSSTIILANNGMPQSLSRTCHPHSQRQERKHGKTLRIVLHHFLVAPYPGVMVYITCRKKSVRILRSPLLM